MSVMIEPGPDGVDADAVRGERQRHHLGELVDAALGHRIGHLVGDGEDGVDRGHVDDGTRRSARGDALDHVPRHRLAAQERALEVGADHPVEIGLVEIEEIAADEHAGIVDQRIDAAERIDRCGDQVVDVEPLADVAGDEAHRAIGAERLDRA